MEIADNDYHTNINGMPAKAKVIGCPFCGKRILHEVIYETGTETISSRNNIDNIDIIYDTIQCTKC
jgi:DNA-directed RNA polymerase subunit RPC12/RpoP